MPGRPSPAADRVLSRLPQATRDTRSVIELAAQRGLKPHFGPDGDRPDERDRIAVLLDDRRASDAHFGVIYVSARTGKIHSSALSHVTGPGDPGRERHFRGARDTRAQLRRIPEPRNRQ